MATRPVPTLAHDEALGWSRDKYVINIKIVAHGHLGTTVEEEESLCATHRELQLKGEFMCNSSLLVKTQTNQYIYLHVQLIRLHSDTESTRTLQCVPGSEQDGSVSDTESTRTLQWVPGSEHTLQYGSDLEQNVPECEYPLDQDVFYKN